MSNQTDQERDDALKFVNNYLNEKPNKRTLGFLDSKWFYYVSKVAKWYLRTEQLKNSKFQMRSITNR